MMMMKRKGGTEGNTRTLALDFVDAVGPTRAVTCDRMEGRLGAAKQQLMQKKKGIFRIQRTVTQHGPNSKATNQAAKRGNQ